MFLIEAFASNPRLTERPSRRGISEVKDDGIDGFRFDVAQRFDAVLGEDHRVSFELR